MKAFGTPHQRIAWCHPQSMMTSTNGNIFCFTGPFEGNPPVTGSPHEGQWRGALMFPDQMAEQTIETPVIETPSRLLWRHWNAIESGTVERRCNFFQNKTHHAESCGRCHPLYCSSHFRNPLGDENHATLTVHREESPARPRFQHYGNGSKPEKSSWHNRIPTLSEDVRLSPGCRLFQASSGIKENKICGGYEKCQRRTCIILSYVSWLSQLGLLQWDIWWLHGNG